MSEITFKNGQPVPPKRKRKKSVFARIFWPLFTIFILLPIALVGILFALLYDSTHTPIKYREDYTVQEVFNDVITHSLDTTVTEHLMRVRVTEDALNQLFHNVTYQEGKKTIEFINNLYIKINEKNYVFCVEVDLYGFFKTRVFFTTKLKVTEEDIIFKLTDIKIGHLAGLANLAKFIAQNANISDINKIFHDNGFNMELDINTLSIVYPKANLIEDLGNAFPESESGYVTLLSDIILNDKFTSILPNNEKALEVQFNLENMRPTSEIYNIENYTMPDGYLNTLLSDAAAKVKHYLETNVITPDHAQAVAHYYVSGYDYISEEQKAIVDGYLSSSAISVAADTYSYEVPNSDNLATIASSQLSHYPTGADLYEVIYNTNQIDRALSQATSIGEVIIFKSKDEEGNYTVNYISLDRITNVIDAGNNMFFLMLSMNFNGYDIGLSLKTSMDLTTTPFGQVEFHIEDMYIGDEAMSDTAKSFFIDIVKDSIEDGAFDEVVTIKTVDDELYLNINLVSILATHNITEEDGYSTSYELSEQTATTPGQVKFKAYR